MSIQKKHGAEGEELAVRYLRQKGLEILHRNWRISRAEVDIIARVDRTVVFVEVKSRLYTYYGPPDAFVTAKQEALLVDAAHQYIEETGHEDEIRFDIVAVVLDGTGGAKEITHFEDAFFPGID